MTGTSTPEARTQALRRLAKEPKRAIPRILRHPKKREMADEFLGYVDATIDQEPRQGLRLAQIGVRLSAGLGDRFLARALGALAHGHRALGHYQKAHRTLEIAFGICDDAGARAALQRREAHLLCSEGRLDTAADSAEKALELSRSLDDDDGYGRALMVRGNVQWMKGENRAAGESARAALRYLSPQSSAHFRRAALYLISLSLAHDGQSTDLRKALSDLARIQKSLRGQYGSSQTAERAIVKWTEALLYQRLGSGNRARALLEKARQAFIRLEMPQEIAAVTADLALVARGDVEEVRQAVRPIGELARDGKIHFPPEITRGLHALWQSTRTTGRRGQTSLEHQAARHQSVLEAIQDLRRLFEDHHGVPVLLLDFPVPGETRGHEALPIGF